MNSLPLPKKIPPPPGTPPIKTQKRGATILPNFVGLRFAVHNGKHYQEVHITEEMVGTKLGEYASYVLFPAFLLGGVHRELRLQSALFPIATLRI